MTPEQYTSLLQRIRNMLYFTGADDASTVRETIAEIDRLRAEVAALKAAQAVQAQPVADLTHPTMEMLHAGNMALFRASGGDFDATDDEVLFVWNAMYAARPQAEQAPTQEQPR